MKNHWVVNVNLLSNNEVTFCEVPHEMQEESGLQVFLLIFPDMLKVCADIWNI